MPPIISKIILLKGGFPKRWDKNLVQEILPEGRIINRVLLIEGYLHISTFYSALTCCQSMTSHTKLQSFATYSDVLQIGLCRLCNIILPLVSAPAHCRWDNNSHMGPTY